jgi:hypothetical protein
MREFLRGWLRKAGCVTLVMACALACLWTRSIFVFDAIHFGVGTQQQCVISSDGMINWYSFAVSQVVGFQVESASRDDALYYWLAIYAVRPKSEAKLAIAYWLLAIPLTLLSSYLLLVPSRKRSPVASQSDA